MRRTDIVTPNGSHPYIVGEGLLSRAGEFVADSLGRTTKIAVVTNPTVAVIHAPALVESLTSTGFDVQVLELPDGEEHKTLETATRLHCSFLESGMDRRSLVAALGGGVIGDLAGFAASTYMRGIDLVHVPTTLLAMVDSSIGGKTGVNLPRGKNLVGAFKQPVAVIADTATLSTLPPVEIASGMAEVIKHGLVGAADLFEKLDEGRPDDLSDIIHAAARVKFAIVEEDPFERGPRALLNLGHTFGHAMEAASGFTLRHGHAVGLGLLASARLAHSLGLCDDTLEGRISRTLAVHDLPTHLDGLAPSRVLPFLASDKKREHGTLRLVIPEEPGRVSIVEDPPGDLVLGALSAVLPD
jgi:3-dehydroquinate synthase